MSGYLFSRIAAAGNGLFNRMGIGKVDSHVPLSTRDSLPKRVSYAQVLHDQFLGQDPNFGNAPEAAHRARRLKPLRVRPYPAE
jgi:hypothetical protein